MKLRPTQRIKNELTSKKDFFLKRLRIFKKKITKDRLIKDLAQAGIKNGDTVMVHASLSKIGNVQGGASTVISALLDQLGSKGNLIMPAFSYINSMENTARRKDYIFDTLSTPSVVGIIAEEFRKWPGVKRSIHPTHSVCAFGPEAVAITEGHLKASSNFGEGTPYHKMIELRGKTCGIGVHIGYPTFYHTVEDLNPELYDDKVYLPKPAPIRVLVNGAEIVKTIFVHNPEFHSVRIDKNKFIEAWMANHLRKKGILHEGRLGSTSLWWMDIQELCNELISLKKNGITIYKVPGL